MNLLSMPESYAKDRTTTVDHTSRPSTASHSCRVCGSGDTQLQQYRCQLHGPSGSKCSSRHNNVSLFAHSAARVTIVKPAPHFALASASAAVKDWPCVCCLGVRAGCCPARGVREPDGAATAAAAAPAAAWACRPSGLMWSPARLAAASASGLTPVGDVGWWRSSATSHTSSTCTPLCHADTNVQSIMGVVHKGL